MDMEGSCDREIPFAQSSEVDAPTRCVLVYDAICISMQATKLPITPNLVMTENTMSNTKLR